MKRRDFIKATALISAGLFAGMTNIVPAPVDESTAPKAAAFPSHGFSYPRGGCTESGLALFDRGPFGKDPFALFV